ncbi:alpha/beta hydrolase [Rhodococcus sp. D2-41]|uniref:alpha/beta hydrolase n=1 Tax=Speluncibacter jeojiensis TaxID=2710754 RepID=UPI002410AA94|nr:alpha/beta hydrolase [Rhodococcus sp. D2-41]MDG3010061.1 alpha/beta hydrolase [Rhodococcus sp. D2-41]
MLNLVPDISSLTAAASTAARNAWALTLGGGVKSPSPVASVVLHEEPHRTLHRFGGRPADGANPVLLVPPLAVATSCYDLLPGQSLVEFLVESGRTPYLVDYGAIRYADHGMGFEDWVDDILPATIRRVSEDCDGADVDLISWSLGGILSLLTAAAHAELPIRSISVVGTPIDYSKNPSAGLLRVFGQLTNGESVAVATRLIGGVPAPLVQLSFRATALQRELTRPWFIARNLHKTETLARMEAIERFMNAMPGYPARLYAQMHKRLILRNDLAAGRFKLRDRTVELSGVKVPVLAVGGTTDVIAPLGCVRAVTNVLPGAASVRFETAPGSHLGVLTGPEARETTWAHIDEFLSDLAEDGPASATADHAVGTN